MREILYSRKKRINLQYRKKQQITVMEKKRNYRITIILSDEIIVERFETEEGARKTVNDMRELFPKMFVGGAVEEKQKKWKVIWTASVKKS